MSGGKSGSKSASRSRSRSPPNAQKNTGRQKSSNPGTLVPLEKKELEKKTVAELKVLLRQKGLPVSGRKSELIERLLNGYTGPKPKPWQYSEAKKDLKRALLDPTSSIHKMSLEEVRSSDDRFKQYPNFGKYFRDLKKQVEAEKEQVKQDDAAAESHLQKNPRSRLTQRGYPHWDTHAAKSLLELDVANDVHQNMTQQQL
ncbi:hypothetical protein ACHAWF_013480 [Thalassiosira exigua]